MDIGHRIRTIRKVHKQKLLNISQLTGLSQPFISEIERGVKVPSLETLEKICHALGLTLSEFFTYKYGDEQEAIPPEVQQVIDKVRKLPPDKLKVLNAVLDTWKGE